MYSNICGISATSVAASVSWIRKFLCDQKYRHKSKHRTEYSKIGGEFWRFLFPKLPVWTQSQGTFPVDGLNRFCSALQKKGTCIYTFSVAQQWTWARNANLPPYTHNIESFMTHDHNHHNDALCFMPRSNERTLWHWPQFWIRCSGWFRVFLVRATSDSLSRKGEKTQGSSRIGTLSGPGPRLLMLWHLCERESVEDTLTTSPSYRPTDVVNDCFRFEWFKRLALQFQHGG